MHHLHVFYETYYTTAVFHSGPECREAFYAAMRDSNVLNAVIYTDGSYDNSYARG